MSDSMRFTPDRIQVKQGETVRLSIRNEGQVMHEFVIGTKKELDEHAALMMKFPGMEHSEPYMAHVAPGKTGEIVWTFNRAGEFDFACLIAGTTKPACSARSRSPRPQGSEGIRGGRLEDVDEKPCRWSSWSGAPAASTLHRIVRT